MTQADTSASPSRKEQRERMLRRFTEYVQDRVEDPAVRRALRPAARYALDDERTEMARWELFQWIHHVDDSASTQSWNVRNAMFLTAGLIAQCPSARTLEDRWRDHARSAGRDPRPPYGLRFDLGLALAELERRTRENSSEQLRGEAGAGRMTPLRKRLIQAVRAEPEDLPLLMSRAIAHLDSQQACVPAWWTLAADLIQHTYVPGTVGMRWQESFVRLPEWRRPVPRSDDDRS